MRVACLTLPLLLVAPAGALAQDAVQDLVPVPAPADEATQRWPDSIQHRNARYADLRRMDDRAGDVHERVLLDAELVRVDDPVGDREEAFRSDAENAVPPKAVAHAVIARDRGEHDDHADRLMASRTDHRQFAEVRRFRDLSGDMGESRRHHDDLIVHGPPSRGARARVDRAVAADAVTDFLSERYFRSRLFKLLHGDAESPDEIERHEERYFERIGEGLHSGDFERELERELDREVERELEGELDDLEKQTEDFVEEAETELERELEKTEAELERDLERQIQQEEEGLLDDATGGGAGGLN